MTDKFIDEVWVSAARTTRFDYPSWAGMAFKFFEHNWEPLEDTRPVNPGKFHFYMNSHNRGDTLERSQFPEAACVFDERKFDQVGELVWFNGFLGVRGKLAEIFKRVDLGQGGGLLPIPVFNKDCQTKRDEDFFLINWGQHNNQSFNPDESSGIEKMMFFVEGGPDAWKLGYGDFEISVHNLAANGPDVWVEPSITCLIFMKGWVAEIILNSSLNSDLILRKCKVGG